MSQITRKSVNENEEIVSIEFFTNVKVRILRETTVYLLKELLEDVIYVRNIALYHLLMTSPYVDILRRSWRTR